MNPSSIRVPGDGTLADELPLLSPTSSAWAELAAGRLDVFLPDHAVCEQQAALTALNLVAHYPEDDDLVEAMGALAAEEVSHLEGIVEEAAEADPKRATPDPGKPSKGNGQGKGKGNGNDRLTNAQLKAIYAIAKRKNMGHKSVNEFTIKMFGVQADALTKDQASHVISSLQK